ncbi:uncharacterized protein [Oscarella lobularis]|uniref:uncharacterized protein isoform X2 n=1 Tax=Oscarella lobularis TaxID=121494 RepID=UPI0033142C96
MSFCAQDSFKNIEETCSIINSGRLRNHRAVVQYCMDKIWRRFGLSKDKPAPSCLALRQFSGKYWIKPSTSPSPFKTYCRVGGWTLIMKIDGAKQTFSYNSSYWTSKTTFNEDFIEFDGNETKLASFWSLPFEELLLGMKTGSTLRWITVQKKAISLRSIILGNTFQSTEIGCEVWKSLVPDSSLQRYCNKEGFNVQFGNDDRVRIGISSNDQNDCNSNDSWLGFGGFSRNAPCGLPDSSDLITCGNSAGCSPDNGDKIIASIGYIFAR